MKRTSPFICIALLFFAVSVFTEEKKPVKVITINNVRIMEISKKENKAQYRQKASETKPETAADEAPKTPDAAPPPNRRQRCRREKRRYYRVSRRRFYFRAGRLKYFNH